LPNAPTYVLRMRELDIKTRGLYIAIACDIERMMDDIIAFCEISDPTKQSNFKRDKIMHLEMGKKLARCVVQIEKYNSAYHQSYLSEFSIIADLVTYRNVMAHGYSEYDNDETDERFITYYNKEKDKIARYIIEPRKFIENMLTFQESLLKLAELVQVLQAERGKDRS